jgi:hypothetical protein
MSKALDIGELKRELSWLGKIDRASCADDDLRQSMCRILGGYTCITRVITSEVAFRARRNDSKPRFDHVAELWYPAPGYVRKLGRVNRVGQSMFYVSASHETATLEMRPAVGDVITILRIKRKPRSEPLHVMELGIAEKQSAHGLPQTVHIPENTQFRQVLAQRPGGVERNLAVRSFLASEFTRIVAPGREHEFKMTIAIGEFLLSSDRIDGLEYPSIAGAVDGWRGAANLVLKPDRADKSFVAEGCWMIAVERELPPPRLGYVVRCIRRAQTIDADGSIVW